MVFAPGPGQTPRYHDGSPLQPSSGRRPLRFAAAQQANSSLLALKILR